MDDDEFNERLQRARIGVVNQNCRRCGALLRNENDVLLGLCNDDAGCKKRAEKARRVFDAFSTPILKIEQLERENVELKQMIELQRAALWLLAAVLMVALCVGGGVALAGWLG